MKINWAIDPLKIIQFILIIILGIYGYSQWSNYLDEKNQVKELKKEYKQADEIIKKQKILLKKAEAKLREIKKEINIWEAKHKAIQMPTDFDDAITALGLGAN